MDIERHYELVGSGKQENPLAKLTGPIATNLNEAIDIALQSYSKIEIDDHTLENREKIADVSEQFHKKADTLTPPVKESLELLANKDVVAIECAHQPSLFPYSGTMIKPVLAHVIAEAMRKQGLSVVELFGLLDTDDISTGWHRRTHLPDMNSKEGILVIRKNVDSKEQIFNAVPAPDLKEITEWKETLVNWVRLNRKGINRIAGKEIIGGALEKIYFDRIKEIFGLWQDLQSLADSYGSFNSLFLTRLINHYWDYPTLFIPYSLSINIFEKEIETFVKQGNRYAESYNKHRDSIKEHITINFAEMSWNHVPFWYICNCGVKVKLFKKNGALKGSCENCNMKFELPIEKIKDYSMKLTPQAVSRHLVFFEGLKPALYISGWGAMPFTLVAKGVADDFNLHFPPIIPFRIREKYYGIGQLRSLLELKQKDLSTLEIDNEIEHLERISDKQKEESSQEYKRLKQELRDLTAIRNALACYPSILDYWVNFGILKTRDNWEEFISAHNFGDKKIIPCLSIDEG
jgi:hypothetical protein